MAQRERTVGLVIKARTEGLAKVQSQLDSFAERRKTLEASLAVKNEIAASGAAFNRAAADAARYAKAMDQAAKSERLTAAESRSLRDAFALARDRAKEAKVAYAQKRAELDRLRGSTQSSFKAFSQSAAAMRAQGVAAAESAAKLQRVKAAQDRLRNTVKSGFAGWSQYADSLARVSTAAEKSAVALERKAAVMQRLQNPIKSGFAAWSKSTVGMRSEADAAAHATAELNRISTASTKAGSAQRKLAGDLGVATGRLRAQGIASADFASRTTAALATRKGRGPLGLRPYELTNLSYQVNDVVSGLAMGQRPMQVFAQQAGQIIQIFPKMTTAILRFAPAIAVLAPFVAALVRINREAETLRFFGSQLEIMAEGGFYSAEALAEIATQADKAGISLKDAKSALVGFVKTGVSANSIEQMLTMAKQLAKVTGESVPEAAGKLGKAFSTGAKGVLELDQEMGFLNATQYETVRALFEAGEETRALTMAQDALADKLGATAEKAGGPWSTSVHELGRAWNNLIEYLRDTIVVDLMGKALNALGESVAGLSMMIADGLEILARETEDVPALELELSIASDDEIKDSIADIEDRIGELQTQLKLPGFAFAAEARREIADLTKELEYLQTIRAIPAADRAQGNFADFDAPVKTAEEWAEQMEAIQRAHERIKAQQEAAAKLATDIKYIVSDQLEDMAEEARLAALTNRERSIEATILEARNEALERANELGLEFLGLTEKQLANLREQAGLSFDNAEAASFGTSFGTFDTGVEAAKAMLREFEGFQPTGKWDKTEFRAGFGSDTITLADGSVKKITEGMRVSMEDALRDFDRRITTEFMPKAVAAAGEDRFNSFTPAQQAALTSIAYNYGSIPDRIAEAVRKGSNEQIAEAIRSLRTDDDGINQGRRLKEAATFGDASTSAATEKLAGDLAAEEERRLKAAEDYNENFAQRISDMQFELQMQHESAREAAVATAIRQAELEAEKAGVALTKERRDQIVSLTRELYDSQNAEAIATGEVNRLLEYRTQLLANLKLQNEAGDASAAQQTEEQLSQVGTALDQAILKAIAFWEAMGGPDADIALAKLRGLQQELENFGDKSIITGKQINEGIAGIAVDSFHGLAEAFANGENAFQGFFNAFRKGAAEFLLQISKMIIQQAILNALGGGASGGGGVGGGIAGIIGKLFHEGGVVGRGGTSRMVPASVFANAARFHQGGMPGLKRNEVPAVLEKGEEVLTRDDPRHALNGGGGQQGDMKVVNAIDGPSFLEEAMKSVRGERVFLNYVSANSSAVRSALGV